MTPKPTPTMETIVHMAWPLCSRNDVAYEHPDAVPCDTHSCVGNSNQSNTGSGTRRYSSATGATCASDNSTDTRSCSRHRVPNATNVTDNTSRHDSYHNDSNTKSSYHNCGSDGAFMQQRSSSKDKSSSNSKVLYVELVRSHLALRATPVPYKKRRHSSHSSLYFLSGSSVYQQLWTLVLLVWVLALVLITDMVTYGPDLEGGAVDDAGINLGTEDGDPIAALGSAVKDPKPRPQEVPVSRPLRVEVYYEALCPDSRSFVMKQLLPAYTALSDIMDVHIVPYGKATTTKDKKTGDIGFSCQHGPTECEANRVHACVANTIQDKAKVLNIVSCMIDRNSNPLKIGQFCVEKYGVAWSDVETCVKSKKGSEVLRHMGELTHSLKPPVSFIPTITIDGSQDDQRLILRSFQKVLCNKFKGPKPENCP